MNELQIFKSNEFGEIRSVTINDEPWFVGKDVAVALGYKNTKDALATHVDDCDKIMGSQNATLSIKDSMGREQYPTWINESGLYALIFGSKLESAKRFKHWVTSEVLPTIRKTGGYQKPMSALELMELQMQAIKEVDAKVSEVNKDLQDFKEDMPILGIEESRITAAVKKKGVKCLGGKASEAYHDKSLRGKVYADIYGQLKREFGVETYKAIKRGHCDKAVSIIDAYELPLVLREAVEDCNAQLVM